MKIACIIHSLDGGGAERVMAGLSSRLAGRGHDLTLITLDEAKKDRHHVDPAVQRIALNVMGPGDTFLRRADGIRRRLKKVREAIQNLNPDVVLSFCDRTNVLVLMATRGLKVPVVVSERSDPRLQSLGIVGEFARRVCYRRAASVVALTDTAAEYLQRYSPRQVVVIPSAVASTTLDTDRSLAVNNRLVLGIGRLEVEKGFDLLLAAFAKFQQTQTGTGWSLRILGEGSQRKSLQSMIAELGISSVTMPGWIQPVADELGSATIFVLPSRYEGFPSALLEAMASGVPCVAANCLSGPQAIMQHERNGLLVQPTVEGICEGIQQMADQPEKRETMGAAGTEVCKRFSWESMVDHYETLLKKVAAKQIG